MAADLTGPWSDWQALYEIPSPWNNATLGVFECACPSFPLPFVLCPLILLSDSYAPKTHVDYAQSACELIVSYVSNTLALEPLYSDPRIYAPQFIKATFC